MRNAKMKRMMIIFTLSLCLVAGIFFLHPAQAGKHQMFRETLADDNRWFSGVKPFFEMTIGGNN